MKIGNLVIVVLVLVIAVLSAALWWSLDSETAPLPTVLSVQSTTVVPAPEPSAIVPASLPVPIPTPVAPMSEVDQKLSKLGFGSSAETQTINVVK